MNEPYITVTGNVGAIPRHRTVQGVPVTDFRIGSTPRRMDRASGEWSDGETLWFSVSCWRALAQNVAESLRKGDPVVVTGRLLTRSWTTETGETRSGLEIDATSIGLDLSRGTALLRRTERTSSAAGAGAGAAAADGLATSEPVWESTGEVDPQTGEVVLTQVPGEREEAAA